MSTSRRIDPRLILALATALSLPLNMWLGRGLTWTTDELVWFMLSPDLDLPGAFHPYVGHLIVTTKGLYRLIFEFLGPDYWVIRLATCLVLVGVVWIIFQLLRRHCGEWLALGIALIVLFFSGDPAHVFHGNGMTVLGSVGLGLLALLMLDERSGKRNLIACLALVAGVATYSQALPFLVGAAVFLLAAKRFRDLWVPAVPFALYFAWWVWARDFPSASQDSLEPTRIYMLPVWGFRATGAVIDNIVRIPPAGGAQVVIGLVLAAVLVGLTVWLLKQGRANPLFFAGAATLVTMWSLVIVVPVPDRDFDSARYMYPFLLATVVTVGALVPPPRWNRTGAWLFAVLVTACCVGGVVHQSGHNDDQRAYVTVTLRSGLAGIELVRPTDPRLTANDLADPDENFFLNLPFRAMDDLGQPSIAAYTAAVDRFGDLGFSESEILQRAPEAPRLTDRAAARVSGLASLRTISGSPGARRCLKPRVLLPGGRGIAVPPGTFELRNPTSGKVPVYVGRFSPQGVLAGYVPARSSAITGGRDNRGDSGLRLGTEGSALTVCARP